MLKTSTNSSATGYVYSLNNGLTWSNSSSVSLTTLTINNLIAETYDVKLKAIQNDFTSVESNSLQLIPLTVQEMLNSSFTAKQILEYGYVVSDIPGNRPLTLTSVISGTTTNISTLLQYGITPAEIRRHGDFSLQHFKDAGISSSVLCPGKATIIGHNKADRGRRKMTFTLEDLETPKPTSYTINANNQVFTVLAANTIENADGSITLFYP
jgi:hypothetical protein